MNTEMRLLSKLGSILVHAEEFFETHHDFDRIALVSLLNDKEVKAWLAEMGAAGFLPLKRTALERRRSEDW